MPFLNEMLNESSRKRLEHERLAAENEGAAVPAQSLGSAAIESRYRFDVDGIMAAVRSEILGQDEALAALERALRIVRADIADPRRPLHTALFLGPTGVGKTEMVRALARALHGDADAFCRIDMNTLAQEHYAAALTGAPPGYVGSKEGTTLFDQSLIEGSIGKPGIVLFDELEKASDEVVQALLNVFDNGRLTVASGERTYSFRNSLVFMTSNLGAKRIQAHERAKSRWPRRLLPPSPQRDRRVLTKLAEHELLRRFTPEFVNRIDTITVFNWLDKGILGALIDMEIQRINRRLAKHGVTLHLGPAVKQYIVRIGFDRKFGARSLRRVIRQHVEAPLAVFLLNELQRSDSPQKLEAYLEAVSVKFRHEGT
ncbi:ATP-dependent Clp protease ATP-binding subunit [Halomonas daqingensis]|uniref:AAA family ATPase n=1 Tax=Billgrantia desiderata TaxID=52021 RepID=UPI000A362F17|nr:AAA family ATPase [Halomonas desiderata]MCE8013441.1 ATP-dependent Clp protease ATP-binding subunit [Halomonas desiderata]MCE8028904.1 ATP-dependent Clp protease ATP-binding subunit [Halomonas desiderata]OUE46768.1 AAA family ATPase [Halomonas desiderata SP1]